MRILLITLLLTGCANLPYDCRGQIGVGFDREELTADRYLLENPLGVIRGDCRISEDGGLVIYAEHLSSIPVNDGYGINHAGFLLNFE